MTSPFTTALSPFPGTDPLDPQPWRTDPVTFWLGRGDRGLTQLPAPNEYACTGYSLGEVEHARADGGSSVDVFDSVTRRWTLGWWRLAGRDYQVVRGFYRRLFGDDPWCYLAPEDRNRLTLAQSMCGALHGAVEGWATASGTLAYDSTAAPQLTPSGVLTWTPGVSNAVLYAQGTVSGVDLDKAAPIVPALPTTWTVWARTLTGTSTVAARLAGRDSAGTAHTASPTGPNTVIGTAWTPLPLPLDPGTYDPADRWLIPAVVTRDAHPIQLCCPDLRYEDAFDPNWEAGAGVPRVQWVAPPSNGRQIDPHMNTGTDMILAETITGAA